VDKKANDTFAFDLENRLDDFFSDSLPSQDEPPTEASPAPRTDLPLKDLKSTILAIDWEITDDALDALIYQIDGLSEAFETDKVNFTFLRLLKSLAKYIRTNKSKSHPDTIKRVMAVYSALEESVTNDELDQVDKEKMLLEEVRQFKRLKAKIVDSSPLHSASHSPKPMVSGEIPGIEAVIRSIDELKSLMATELGAIREELGQLRKK
jgi:hypothetical protein